MRLRVLAVAVLLALPVPGQDLRSRLQGLVFEAEDWAEPKDGWVKDEFRTDKWCLWTAEDDVLKKRSGGQSLRSPVVEADRARPEDGAPPLHIRITGLAPGLYQVWMNHPARNLALSTDGVTWASYRPPSGEIDLGLVDIGPGGAYELWADDRYATPGRIGPSYVDYVRFEAITAPVFDHLAAFTRPDGRTQISWVTDRPLPTGGVQVRADAADAPVTTVPSPAKGLRNHAVVLPELEAGRAYRARVHLKAGGRTVFESPEIAFVAGARATPPPTVPTSVPLTVLEPGGQARPAWPVTSGVPFPAGRLARAADVRLLDADGRAVPVQAEALAQWPDGSVQWLLLDFQTPTRADAATALTLTTAPDAPPAPVPPPLVRDTGTDLLVDTGVLRTVVSRTPFALFDRVAVDRNGNGQYEPDETVTGEPRLGNGRLVAGDGKAYGLAAPDRVTVETNGAWRATVRAEGDFAAPDGTRLFRYRARLTAYRGQRLLRLQWTIGNNRIQDEFTVLAEAGLRIPLRPAGPVTGGLDGGPAVTVAGDQDLWLLQDYDNRVVTHMQGKETAGEHSSGLAWASGGGATITAAVRDFWQTYPKGLAVKPDGLHVRLLPPLAADAYTSEADRTDATQISLHYAVRDGKYLVKRGLENTTEVWVEFGSGPPAPAGAAARLLEPLVAVAAPSAYCESGAFGPVSPFRPDEFPEYWAAFDESFRNLEKGRQTRHEYGWMNYGDWWGERSWNWGNSEYDLAYCLAVHFAQTGRLDLFRRGDQMARHYSTTDVAHYPWSEPMRETVYEHSVGHVGGFFATDDKRITSTTWSMVGFIGGAFDGSGGHSHQAGAFLYGFLTGDRRYLEVAEMACRNQAMTYTPRFDFNIERAAGWALHNAMWAHRATNDPYYLNAARLYVDRIIEKQDPQTGGWRLPQGPPECDCPDAPHVGGKAFAAGVLLHSLVLYHRETGETRAADSMVRGAAWLLDSSWNEAAAGFRYKTGCPKYADKGWYPTLVTDGIAYAADLSHDDRYKAFLLRTLPAALQRRTGSGKAAGKDFTMQYRDLPHTLDAVRRWGVTALPPPAPPAPPPAAPKPAAP